MDDTNPDMTWHYDVDKMGKYSTKTAWQAATRSALASIGARFRTAGKLVIPNFSSCKQYPAVIKDWMSLVDGGMNEQFVKWGKTTGAETYDPPAYWELQLQAMKDAEAAGKYYLGISHSTATDRAAARYGYATALLAGQGACSSRSTPTTRTSTGSTSTTTRSARPRRPRRATRAASTAASSRTASCSSTRRRARSRSTSAVATPAPGSRTRPGRPFRPAAPWCSRRQVTAPLSGRPGEPGQSQKKAKSARASRKARRSRR